MIVIPERVYKAIVSPKLSKSGRVLKGPARAAGPRHDGAVLRLSNRIKLREGAKPFALSTPRRVAIPLLPAVKKELNRMEQLGVIRLRICVDLTKLNANILREHHILPAVEQTLTQVLGA